MKPNWSPKFQWLKGTKIRETYCMWIERWLKIKSSWTNTNKRGNQMIKDFLLYFVEESKSYRTWPLSLLKRWGAFIYVAHRKCNFGHKWNVQNKMKYCQNWPKNAEMMCICLHVCVFAFVSGRGKRAKGGVWKYVSFNFRK